METGLPIRIRSFWAGKGPLRVAGNLLLFWMLSSTFLLALAFPRLPQTAPQWLLFTTACPLVLLAVFAVTEATARDKLMPRLLGAALFAISLVILMALVFWSLRS